MKILICFGDNDFHTVMRTFGELFVSQWGSRRWHPERLTKATIVRWFNTIAPTLYQMVQARDRMEGLTDDGYLSITEARVYLGEEEVAAKMDSYAGWGNGDAVLIDLGDEHKTPVKWLEPSVTIL